MYVGMQRSLTGFAVFMQTERPVVPAPPPALAPLKPCYVSVESAPGTFSSEVLALAGSGFDPGERLSVLIDGAVVLTGLTAAADGTLPAQTVMAPVQDAGERAFTLALTDADDARVRAIATARVTALAVRVRPKSARPQDTVRISGRGFTDSGAIYAHYVRRNVVRRTVLLASSPADACGRFSVKRPQFPFRPAEGVWRVQVDQHADLGTDGPLVNLTVDVRRRPVTRP